MLEDLSNNLQTVNREHTNKDESGVFVFFSFDLVNSTLFKTLHQNNWFVFIKEFYDSIISIRKHEPTITLWKYVGDEVLFYKKILDKNEIYNLLLKTREIIDYTERKLQEIDLIEQESNKCKTNLDIKLYVKATLWIAKASKNVKGSKNIVIDTEKGLDFIGEDIDLGFRISKYSFDSKIVLDAIITYMLIKQEHEIKKKYHISIRHIY